MSCFEILSLISRYILAFSVLIGTIMAWRGIESWKKEHRGRKEFDVALRILTIIRRIRRLLHDIRLDISIGDSKIHLRDQIETALNEYDGVDVEADILFGDLLKKPKAEFKGCITQYRGMWRRIHQEPPRSGMEKVTDRYLEAVDFLEAEDPSQDEFGKRVSNAERLFTEALDEYLGINKQQAKTKKEKP